MPLDDSADPAAPPASWRDHIHPAADLFPIMGEAELQELGRDILANGLQQPLVYCGDQLLDGRNRLAAVETAAPPEDRARLVRLMLEGGSDPDFMVTFPPPRALPEHDDPVAYVVSANVLRRHLTGEQKRELVAKLLIDRPERSDRATGKLAQADHKTVAAVRSELEGRGEIPHVETRTDTIGREHPTKKRADSKRAKPPRPSRRTKIMIAFGAELHTDLAQTLDDLTQLLRDERTRIAAEIPLHKRIVLARGYLHALSVSFDDLQPIGGGP